MNHDRDTQSGTAPRVTTAAGAGSWYGRPRVNWYQRHWQTHKHRFAPVGLALCSVVAAVCVGVVYSFASGVFMSLQVASGRVAQPAVIGAASGIGNYVKFQAGTAASSSSSGSSSSGSSGTPPALASCSTSGATGAGSPSYEVQVGAPVAGGGNSATEIQSAIAQAAAHSGGGVVVLASGIYTIDATINLANNVELEGAGESSTTLLASSTTSVDPMISTNGANNVTVADVTVNQNGESAAAVQNLGAYMVEDDDGSNVIFEEIATRDPSTYSIATVSATDFCIRNSDVLQDPGENGKYDQLDGIHILDSSDGDVRDNYVDNSYDGATDGDDGLVAHGYGGTVSNVTYEGNVVRGGQNGAGMGIWIASGAVTNITITGNEFWGLSGPQHGDAADFTNSSITDNNLHNNSDGITLAGDGITVAGNELCSSGTVTVTGTSNTVTNNSTYSGCSDSATTTAPPPQIP